MTIDKMLTERQYDEAIELLDFYIQDEPSLFCAFSDVFMKHNLFTHALEILNKAQGKHPDNMDIQRKLIDIDFKLTHYVSVIEKIGLIIQQQPENTENYCLLGEAHYFLEQYDKTREAFEKAHSIDGNNKQVYFQFVRLYLAIGDREKAQEWEKKAQEKFPDDKDLLYRISGLYNHLNPLNEKVNSEDDLLAILKKSLWYFPHNLKYTLALANEYFKQKNYFEALKNYNLVFEKEQALIKEDSTTCENYADTCYEVSGNAKDEKILNYYILAFEKSPSNRLRYKIAIILWANENYNQAIEHIKAIVDSEEQQCLSAIDREHLSLALYQFLIEPKSYDEASFIINDYSKIKEETYLKGRDSYKKALKDNLHNDSYSFSFEERNSRDASLFGKVVTLLKKI